MVVYGGVLSFYPQERGILFENSQASAPGVALVLEPSAGRSQGQPFERASQGKFLRKWGRKCQLWPFYMGNFHEILGEEYRTN